MSQSPESLPQHTFPPEEDYVFERHYSQKAIDDLWRLTKPASKPQAGLYHQALTKVNAVADTMFFYRPFYLPKPDGSQRLIFYAQDEMAVVHYILAHWLRSNTPYRDDYCYQRGRGVEEAIKFHLRNRPRFGYVFDLRHAYMRITKSMLARQMELVFGRDQAEAIAVAADFMTVAGRLREGTVTAPFAFNLALHPFNHALRILRKEKDLVDSPDSNLAQLTVTQYADNFAITSPVPINFDLLERQVCRFVRGHGLELSWTKKFSDQPIEYLGTVMYADSVTLDPEKLGLYYDTLLEAINSPTPKLFYKTIVGQFNWLRRITNLDQSSKKLDDLWTKYQTYFALCRKIPAKANAFFTSCHQYGFEFED